MGQIGFGLVCGGLSRLAQSDIGIAAIIIGIRRIRFEFDRLIIIRNRADMLAEMVIGIAAIIIG